MIIADAEVRNIADEVRDVRKLRWLKASTLGSLVLDRQGRWLIFNLRFRELFYKRGCQEKDLSIDRKSGKKSRLDIQPSSMLGCSCFERAVCV
jgi:hypothetical protein